MRRIFHSLNIKSSKYLRDISCYYDNINLFSHCIRYFTDTNYKFLFLFRYVQSIKNPAVKKFSELFFKRFCNKYLICISVDTKIGTGLCLVHNGPVTINRWAIIGEKCIIHPCTLIGGNNGKGSPVIGNNVFVGNGTKIIGKCHIGDDVFISPGAIITKDIPSDAIVVGGINNILKVSGGREKNLLYRN